MLRTLALIGAGAFCASVATAEVSLSVTYLRVAQEAPPKLSNLDPIPEDRGLAGAEVGLVDNVTTGRFLGHVYEMSVVDVALGEDPSAAAQQALAQSPYLILDAPAAAQSAIADLPEAAGALLFNTSAPDNALRRDACRANLLHTLPSNAMRTDALAQFFVKRRWD